MYHYTNESRVPAIWRPYADEPTPPPIQIYYDSSWQYRVPVSVNNAHFTPGIPHLFTMQQMLPVNHHNIAMQEPPIKRRCISLEAFMKDRLKQGLPKFQQVKGNAEFTHQTKQALVQQTAGEAQSKINFPFKVSEQSLSNSSGVSSLPSIPITSNTSRDPSTSSARDCRQLATNAKTTNLDFDNELLRIAIQCGPQPRLHKFIFQVDDSLKDDFALDNYDSPNPVVRISRFKFNWIFQDQPQMSRKFKRHDEPKSSSENSETEKKQTLFSARQKNRISMAISDIEEFVTKEMTREKMLLISRYRAFNKVLRAALLNVDKESV